MTEENSISQLKLILEKSSSVLVVLKPKASQDQVASAIAFFRGLRELGKDVSLVSPEEIELEEMLGLDDVKYKLGNKDLSVSFDYDEQSVDKVSYHIDEEKNKFYLVIKPQKGYAPLDISQVSFDYVGAQADLIFLVGVHQYESLEHLYENYTDVYESATVVTIHNFEPEIGDFKINISGKSCWSEEMVGLLESFGLSLDNESATNLLASIENATDRLSSFTANAETFEVVAKLMRAGAKRLAVRPKATSVEATQSEMTAGQDKLVEKNESTEIDLSEVSEKLEAERAKHTLLDTTALDNKKQSVSKISKIKKETVKNNSQNNYSSEKMKDKSFVPNNLVGRV